jgi:myo-inositol 2-dehydrogenase / D-chiro-inositol 1-dehydrogenase
MADRPLRIAVIGIGRIGSLHAALLAGRVEGAELAAVADIDADRAGELASRLRVPALGVDEAIGADVDAVAVCSSTDAQVGLVVAAAEAGRQVFCEKPVAYSLAELDRAIDATERAGVLFHVGYNRRFDPGHSAVRDAVATGEVGELHLVRITSRDPEPPPAGYVSPGGLLGDTTIHDFDMARFVTGSEVAEVFARGAVRVATTAEGDLDTAVVVLQHADGTITAIDNSRSAVYGYDQRVEAFGSKGMAASGQRREHEAVVWDARGGRSAPLQRFFVERYEESYTRQWSAFVAAVRAGGPAPVDGRDARAALAIALAARRSVDQGQPVLASP